MVKRACRACALSVGMDANEDHNRVVSFYERTTEAQSTGSRKKVGRLLSRSERSRRAPARSEAAYLSRLAALVGGPLIPSICRALGPANFFDEIESPKKLPAV